MTSNNNLTGPKSHSPDKSHRNRRRRSLPSKLHHNDPIYHPYFSRHANHYNIRNDDSVDTTLSNQGLIFYQNSNNGEVDFYWDNESEICSPSLMPDMLTVDEISGDSIDIDEKYFKMVAKVLSNRRAENMNGCKPIPGSTIDVDYMAKEMSELSSDKNQELKEREQEQEQEEEQGEEQEEPPSPTSPRDPEREGPVLSEEEEDTEEGALYRLEHDPEFQDEAGLMYGEDSEGKVNPDDEGMDPMENM